MGTTGQSLVFMREGLVFSARRMEGRYVDTDRLIAGVQNSFTVLSDAAELRQVLSSVLPLAAGDRVRLSFADGRLTLHCSGEQGDSDAALDIVPLTGIPSGNYWFCASKLSKCLRALDGAMTLGLAQGGMLTVSTENAKYLQTPMRPPAARKEKTKRVPKAA